MTLFLKDNRIDFKKDESAQINDILIDHFDILCFNIASIATVLATINNKTLDSKLIEGIKDYIHVSCKKGKKVKGGSMPSDYYGYQNSIYSAANENMGTNTGTIDFDAGVQRAALGSQSGGAGGVVYDDSMKKRVKSILQTHEISFKQSVFKELMNIVNDNLLCLLGELKDTKSVSAKKIDALMKEKRFAVFN